MRSRKLILILVTILIFISSISFGDDIEIPKVSESYYVYDDANIISSELENYIVDKNKKLYEETGSEIIVSAVSSLEGIDIRKYSSEMFKKWEIGSPEKSSGLLVLIAPSEDKIWIEIGLGIKDSLRDKIRNGNIEEEMGSYFLRGDFENGVLIGFNSIITVIENEYNINLGNIRELPEPVEDNSFQIPWKFILLVILIIFLDMKFFKGALFYTASMSIGIGRKGTDYYEGRRKSKR